MYNMIHFRCLSFKVLKMFAESKLNRFWLALVLLPFSLPAAQTPIRLLILTGQNNHAWQETTPVLQSIFEQTESIQVSILTDPLQLATRLDSCDVLVSNWNNWPEVNTRPWGAESEKAFLSFLKKGGGLVLIHAASATMQTWPEFQAIAGATWQLGTTGHGKIHTFKVVAADTLHPFCRGLASFSMKDELWHKMAVQPHVRVLYKAFSDEKNGGSGAWEPVVLTTTYGKGRCFFSVLGHDVAAMQSEAWRRLLVSGTYWAAGRK
jgi:uncharacterized protein